MLETQARFAERLGVSRQAVHKMVRDGKVPVESGKIRVEEALAALGQSVDLSRPGRALRDVTSKADPPSLITARKAEIMEQEIARRQLDLASKREALVQRDSVGREIETIFRRFRDRILAVPQALKRRLAQESDPEICRQIIAVELRSALTEAADSIEAESESSCLNSTMPDLFEPPRPEAYDQTRPSI